MQSDEEGSSSLDVSTLNLLLNTNLLSMTLRVETSKDEESSSP